MPFVIYMVALFVGARIGIFLYRLAAALLGWIWFGAAGLVGGVLRHMRTRRR